MAICAFSLLRIPPCNSKNTKTLGRFPGRQGDYDDGDCDDDGHDFNGDDDDDGDGDDDDDGDGDHFDDVMMG